MFSTASLNVIFFIMHKNPFFWYIIVYVVISSCLGSRTVVLCDTVIQVPGWPLKDSLGNLGWTPVVMWPRLTNRPTDRNEVGEIHVVHRSSLWTWQLVDWGFVRNLKQNFLWTGCNLFKIMIFNDVSGITLIAIASSAAYIHFKSKVFCNLPAILKMSPTLLLVGFFLGVLRNRMKSHSKWLLALRQICRRHKISQRNVWYSSWHFQMAPHSCHTPSFGRAGALSILSSLNKNRL